MTSEFVIPSTLSIFEPIESSVFKPIPTPLGVTTSEFETTGGSSFSTDAAVITSIPVYVWPIAIIAVVAVIVAIVLAIIVFWKTKRSKYVINWILVCEKHAFIITIGRYCLNIWKTQRLLLAIQSMTSQARKMR